MASLVPTLDQINQFPTPLTAGERALMEALLNILDEEWTIYVQPNLNGLQPDIIIFSEEAGLGIFEVKDWNLVSYRVHSNGLWDVYNNGKWNNLVVRCPLTQVKSYKDDIYRYELPELEAEKVLDVQVYSLIAPFVYFHCHTTRDARAKTSVVHDPYITVFGHDDLRPERLRRLLEARYLKKGSNFSGMMKRYELKNRLLNALDYPEHGRLSLPNILFPLTPKQKELLANDPGRRRVIGAAGSGKTMLLARKAVNAALNNQKVLIVVFNITMVNYLADVVRQLARSKSRNGLRPDRLILVRHYHRLYPGDIEPRKTDEPIVLKDEEVEATGPFDVILIDEGQDFKRQWIERLYGLAKENAHVLFVEDDRQNVYGIDTKERRKVPGISGAPNKLTRSFRIPAEVADLGNRLVAWSKAEFESGDVEPAPPPQGTLPIISKPVWVQGNERQMLASLADEIRRLIDENRSGAFADLVVLVCTVENGWEVCERLDGMRLPYICNFESRAEYVKLAQIYSDESLELNRKAIRRARKIAFRMQTGRVKVCTIHSFKGWELRHVLASFRPAEEQAAEKISLLYTAITRTQDSVAVFNADAGLFEFGRLAAQEGLVAIHEPRATPIASPQPLQMDDISF